MSASNKASLPIAVLFAPIELTNKVLYPTAVFPSLVSASCKAAYPIATLPFPGFPASDFKAKLPTATFRVDEILPLKV